MECKLDSCVTSCTNDPEPAKETSMYFARFVTSTLSIVLSFSAFCMAFQTSSEQIQPFNRYSSGQSNVADFTSGGAYSIPLVRLTSPGEASIAIQLNYSSNVATNVRSRNDIAPTEWDDFKVSIS